MNKKLPILFLWDKSYGAYIPNSYRQIYCSNIYLKNKIKYTKFPSTLLWVGKYWTSSNSSCFRTIDYIRDEELRQGSKIIGTRATVEDVMEVDSLKGMSPGLVTEHFRLSINTSKRVQISDIALGPDGFYYGQYEPYNDLPLAAQEKEKVLSIIEELKEKYVIYKSLKPERIGEIAFPVKLNSQTIVEYASQFSFDFATMYKEENDYFQTKLLTGQDIVLRLHENLRRLKVLIEEDETS